MIRGYYQPPLWHSRGQVTLQCGGEDLSTHGLRESFNYPEPLFLHLYGGEKPRHLPALP
jgi:hypothetical protein